MVILYIFFMALNVAKMHDFMSREQKSNPLFFLPFDWMNVATVLFNFRDAQSRSRNSFFTKIFCHGPVMLTFFFLWEGGGGVTLQINLPMWGATLLKCSKVFWRNSRWEKKHLPDF